MVERRGGSRKGAGRKRTRDKYFAPINMAERQIADWLPDLIGNMKRLADGVTVRGTDKAGEPLVYAMPPDRGANEYLINRLMGKPVERKVVKTPDGKGIRFVEVVRPGAEQAETSSASDETKDS